MAIPTVVRYPSPVDMYRGRVVELSAAQAGAVREEMLKRLVAEPNGRIDNHLLSGAPLTISAECVRGFLQGAVRQGRDPRALFRRAGLPARACDDADMRFDGRQLQRLLHTTQGELNDIFLGFMAEPGKFGLDREQARVRLRCRTVGEALRVSTQFREAVRNDISYDYSEDDERHEFTLMVNYQTIDGVDRELFHWHRLVTIYRYYCWLTGRQIVLSRVGFEGSEPNQRETRRRYDLFGCEVRFGQPFFSISIDKKYLLYPIVRKSETEHRDWLINDPDIFHIPGEEISWKSQTEQVLVRLQDDEVWSPTISMVGAILSIDARSLRANLAREKTSFAELKARLRCEAAVSLLITTDVPINIIAERVGFGEPGDFTRAFIGWTGINPSAYKQRNGCNKELIAACTSRLRNRRLSPN